MRSICCALVLFAGSLGMIGLSGCAEDNEKSAKLTSVPAGTDPGVVVPKTQEEQRKLQEEQQKKMMNGGGYPKPQ